MQLICKTCQADQPVNVADEADEDPRTQGIRRAFRLEHTASCGEGSVSLQLHDARRGPPVDFTPQAWTTAAPEGVTLGADGYFTTVIERDGEAMPVRVCEDCWQAIPRYVEFPLGLTSPESAKPRAVAMGVASETGEELAGYQALAKAVCVPCFLRAFARTYPDAPLPECSTAVYGDRALEAGALQAHLTTVDVGVIAEPKA